MLNRDIGIARQSDAHAVVDLNPVPPYARRDEGPWAFEKILQRAPSHRRLHRWDVAIAKRNLIADLNLLALPVESGEELLRELRDRGQVMPLAVDSHAGLLLAPAVDRKADIEPFRTVEEIEVAYVKRSSELLTIGNREAIVNRNGVEDIR